LNSLWLNTEKDTPNLISTSKTFSASDSSHMEGQGSMEVGGEEIGEDGSE